MFTGLKTLDNQIAALEAHFGYIHPVEIPLGYRIDQKLDRHSDILEAILAEQKSPNGILGSFSMVSTLRIMNFFAISSCSQTTALL
ncbi:hypothetical protein KQX54_000460 [Cotesia glomerata]|uniref:Uncharacterized protein n=1 Tax=Cotesia glomerata TaxID=32391 RepID=A0AAV7II71_COTGL|nr:hypothetical protein KQX54_000460 [Cotesia glomerata]